MSDNEVSAREQRLLNRNANRNGNQDPTNGAGPRLGDDESRNSSRNSVSTNSHTLGTNDENVDPNIGSIATPIEGENQRRGIEQNSAEGTPVFGPTGQMFGHFFPTNQSSNVPSQASRTGNDNNNIPGPATIDAHY